MQDCSQDTSGIRDSSLMAGNPRVVGVPENHGSKEVPSSASTGDNNNAGK